MTNKIQVVSTGVDEETTELNLADLSSTSPKNQTLNKSRQGDSAMNATTEEHAKSHDGDRVSLLSSMSSKQDTVEVVSDDMVETIEDFKWATVEKVQKYPIVNAAVDNVHSLYENTKGYNEITKYAFEAAEKTGEGIYTQVNTLSKPVLEKLETHIVACDKYAAETLTNLEENAPIITEQPDEIYNHIKESTYQSLTHAMETSKARINESYVGMVISGTISPVISIAEKAVEFIMPAEKEVEPPIEKNEIDDSDINLKATIARAKRLSNKIKKNTLESVTIKLKNVQKRSEEVIQRMAFTVDLIEYAKGNFNSTVDKSKESINNLYQTVFPDEPMPENDESNSEQSKKSKIERRALQAASSLSRCLQQGSNYIFDYGGKYFSEEIQKRAEMTRQYISLIHKEFSQAESASDLSRKFLNETKENLVFIQSVVISSSQKAIQILNDVTVAKWKNTLEIPDDFVSIESNEDNSEDEQYSSNQNEF